MDKGTSYEPLVNLLLARRINSTLGGLAVTPWDIPKLPRDELDLFLAFVDDLPAMKSGRAKVEVAQERWRMNNKHYANRVKRMRELRGR